MKFLLAYAIVISAIGLLLSIGPETAIIRRNYTHTHSISWALEFRGEHVCVKARTGNCVLADFDAQ